MSTPVVPVLDEAPGERAVDAQPRQEAERIAFDDLGRLPTMDEQERPWPDGKWREW